VSFWEHGGVPDVDYHSDDIAERYAEQRSLRDDVLQRWQAAVRPYLPHRRPLRVLDLGAGTGIFTRAWARWYESQVIALEPSSAMRTQLRAGGLPDVAQIVAGRGEHLPLRPGTVHVAWLSTVLHHLEDPMSAAQDLARVLTAAGVVLIRGLWSDCGAPVGLGFFPNADRALAAFPSTERSVDVFRQQGYAFVDSVEVEDQGPRTIGQAIRRVHRLRGADSLLASFTQDEINQGLSAMGHLDPETPLPPSTVGLLVLQRCT
jgi:SAM-dependent methyltransferase